MVKRLTSDDKKEKALEFFHETKEPYTIKDLEAMLQKKKGIVSNKVKEVVEELHSDGLVHCEKIGQSQYVWSFPSEKEQIKKNELEKLETEIGQYEAECAELEKTINAEKKVRKESKERDKKLVHYYQLEKERKENEQILVTLKELDPVLFNKNKEKMQKNKEATNRWTDNLFAVMAYCEKTFMLSRKDLLKQAELPGDIDYV